MPNWDAQIVREKRWKEVTAVFNFPSTATNASFVLRKYYLSLIYHYEQIYFFKAKGWSPCAGMCGDLLKLCYYNFFVGHSNYRSKQKSCADPFQGLCSPPVPSRSLAEPVRPSPEIQAAAVQPPRVNAAEVPPTGFLSMLRCLAIPTNMKVETTCCIFAVYYCTTHLFYVRLFLVGACCLWLCLNLFACLIRGLFWGGIGQFGLFEVVQVNPLFGYQSILFNSC